MTNIWKAFRDHRRAHPTEARSWSDWRNDATPPLFRAPLATRRAQVAKLRAEHPELFHVEPAAEPADAPPTLPAMSPTPMTLEQLAEASQASPMTLSEAARRLMRRDPALRDPAR